jgi:hypothetical protein
MIHNSVDGLYANENRADFTASQEPSGATKMGAVALSVVLKAKPAKEQELSAFLAGA